MSAKKNFFWYSIKPKMLKPIQKKTHFPQDDSFHYSVIKLSLICTRKHILLLNLSEFNQLFILCMDIIVSLTNNVDTPSGVAQKFVLSNFSATHLTVSEFQVPLRGSPPRILLRPQGPLPLIGPLPKRPPPHPHDAANNNINGAPSPSLQSRGQVQNLLLPLYKSCSK